MYLIDGLCHRRDIRMGTHGFVIYLSPEWKALVAKSGITQENVEHLLKNSGRRWLDAAGFDAMVDPDDDRSPFEQDQEPRPPGPNAYPLYKPGFDLRVAWGEWGPEHISVPGNACGLDLDRNVLGSPFHDEKYNSYGLLPHNVDSLHQKYLLLITFTELAKHVVFRTLRS